MNGLGLLIRLSRVGMSCKLIVFIISLTHCYKTQVSSNNSKPNTVLEYYTFPSLPAPLGVSENKLDVANFVLEIIDVSGLKFTCVVYTSQYHLNKF